MSRSKAFREFRSALGMASELMRQEVRLTRDPPPSDKQRAARGLRGGAAVLMVAAFEAYLDDLIEEYVEWIAKSKPSIRFEKLPDTLRVANVYLTLEAAMNGPKHQPAGSKVDRLAAVKAASSIIARDMLNPSAFVGTGGNPGKNAVKELFKRVGLHDVFSVAQRRFERRWGKPVVTDFTREKLEEIVQRRHRVAHRADALRISRADLREAERFLRVFGEVLDIELSAHARHLRRSCR